MTSLAAWMEARRPPPPADLAERVHIAGVDVAPHVALADEGRARLAAARARPGRVRESAFRLLEADALFTYACEAALETDDPEAALRGILAATQG
ncbi:MAG: hypothetical protein FJ207_00225 [Gemmatimonadetes bacterium]|nr:hypothetical protein [Gemmatimonadota bacterium]